MTDAVAELRRRSQDARDAGRIDEALALQMEAVALLREAGDLGRLAHALRHVGDIMVDAGHAVEAGPAIDEMLAIYRSLPEPPPLAIANAVRSAAMHAGALGDRQTALALWREARDRYAALTAEIERMSGQPGNPGVAEAERRIAALG